MIIFRSIPILMTTILVTVIALASVSAVGGAGNASLPQRTVTPVPTPDHCAFVAVIDNPYMPLVPGTTFHYAGRDGHTEITNETTVTHDTKVVDGVTTIVVRDQGFEEGVLAEDTFDWYAQDSDGNVWYFGEDTKELDEDGNAISTEGSWEAGVDGALPGIVMLAKPRGRYYQEVAPGVAEDMGHVLNKNRSRCVDYGCFDHVLVIRETSPLHPGIVERKYYAPGVGFIYSMSVKGGQEFVDLVDITTDSP